MPAQSPFHLIPILKSRFCLHIPLAIIKAYEYALLIIYDENMEHIHQFKLILHVFEHSLKEVMAS